MKKSDSSLDEHTWTLQISVPFFWFFLNLNYSHLTITTPSPNIFYCLYSSDQNCICSSVLIKCFLPPLSECNLYKVHLQVTEDLTQTCWSSLTVCCPMGWLFLQADVKMTAAMPGIVPGHDDIQREKKDPFSLLLESKETFPRNPLTPHPLPHNHYWPELGA